MTTRANGDRLHTRASLEALDAAYLATVRAGASRDAETARLATQREIQLGLLPGEELAFYAPGVTAPQVIAQGLIRQKRTRTAEGGGK